MAIPEIPSRPRPSFAGIGHGASKAVESSTKAALQQEGYQPSVTMGSADLNPNLDDDDDAVEPRIIPFFHKLHSRTAPITHALWFSFVYFLVSLFTLIVYSIAYQAEMDKANFAPGQSANLETILSIIPMNRYLILASVFGFMSLIGFVWTLTLLGYRYDNKRERLRIWYLSYVKRTDPKKLKELRHEANDGTRGPTLKLHTGVIKQSGSVTALVKEGLRRKAISLITGRIFRDEFADLDEEQPDLNAALRYENIARSERSAARPPPSVNLNDRDTFLRTPSPPAAARLAVPRRLAPQTRPHRGPEDGLGLP